MSVTLPDVRASDPASSDAGESDAGTRLQVLRLIAADGPVSAADIARELDLTPAAIRRHLGVLEGTEQVAVHEGAPGLGPARRGRPARRYVATNHGQAALSQRYSELAGQALRYLSAVAGPGALSDFAESRVRDLEQRYTLALASVGPDTNARVAVLAGALASDGYAATARPVPGGSAIQLCQGHCPVQEIAAEFPQLCEAEAHAFSRLLGVHVQRLATLAGGGHVCTTNIPIITTTAPVEGPTP
ncbi:MAG: helix-turn-helix transcriptional regulator [Cellulomonas sp.]